MGKIITDTNIQAAKIEETATQALILPAGVVAKVAPKVTVAEPRGLQNSQRVRNIIRTMFCEDADTTEAQIVAAVREADFMKAALIKVYVRGNIVNVQTKTKYVEMNS